MDGPTAIDSRWRGGQTPLLHINVPASDAISRPLIVPFRLGDDRWKATGLWLCNRRVGSMCLRISGSSNWDRAPLNQKVSAWWAFYGVWIVQSNAYPYMAFRLNLFYIKVCAFWPVNGQIPRVIWSIPAQKPLHSNRLKMKNLLQKCVVVACARLSVRS